MLYSARSTIHSPYTRAAKLTTPVRFDLRSSAVRTVSLSELPVRLEDLMLGPTASDGDPGLIECLAGRTRVPAESIISTVGTSLGNHVAMSALFDAGDEVLIEEPTYDPLLHAARLLGGNLRRFPRRAENNFAIDPDDVRRAITPRTRVVVICNLHNPTSAEVDVRSLRAIGEIAQSVGAHILVDEVYREAVWGAAHCHAFSLGENFVVTTSLTKAYGLGGLRCGWILAAPALAERMRLMQDLFHSTAPRMTEQISAIALRNIGALESRARPALEANRAAVAEILGARRDLEVTIPLHGTVVAPRLLSGDVNGLSEFLLSNYEVGIVPGEHFEMPDHFRIGLGGEPAVTREALQRLAEGLDQFTAKGGK